MGKRRTRQPRYVQEEIAARRIAADLAQQAPNNSWSPPLFYEDREFTCVECGREEVWTAGQQKWWYEVAKGPIFSTAIRCRACRKLLREKHRGSPRRDHAARRRAGKEQ
jgi:hypothetical protein